MTSLQDRPESGALPDAAVNGGLSATYEHIGMLHRKQELLRAAQVAAEEQFLHRAAALYRQRNLSEVDLAYVYRAYADVAVSGFMKRWEAATGVAAGRMQYILRDLKTQRRHAPNMPDGTWRGTWPLAGGPVPAFGTCVVYVLYDQVSVPCYVGSTKNLAARFKYHLDDGKSFAWWTAFPCTDREAAYQLEEKLLAEHKPYLNKKTSR